MHRPASLAVPLLALALLTGVASAGEVVKPKPTPHDLAGRENCLMCHGGAMQGLPAMPTETHKGRDNATCQLCHAADSPVQKADPEPISHELAGREQCMACHGVTMQGIPAAPPSHKGWDVKTCTVCHAPTK